MCRIMENKISTTEAVQFKVRVKDWGLSNTTLEEVFMKVRRNFYWEIVDLL